MSTKLFVGNLSYSVTEVQLQEMFAAHGTVSHVDMIMDHLNGRPRGFAFVTMETADMAESAIKALHGKNVEGRNLTVNVARPKEDRPADGAGFNRNRGPRSDYRNQA